MRWMKQVNIWSIAILLCCVPPVAGASDNMDPLICAVQETIDCAFQQACLSGEAEGLNLPVIFSVNFKEKIIEARHGDGTIQETKIEHLKVLPDQLVLQGFEKRAWNLTIYKPDHRFSGSAIEPDALLGMFGACTVQESMRPQ
ncbi:MAG: hypothetical protein ACR2PH_14420 [Desulfobulbia bacterium]